MLPISKKNECGLFSPIEPILEHCRAALGIEIDRKHVLRLIQAGLIPVFHCDSDELVLADDLLSLQPVLSQMSTSSESLGFGALFGEDSTSTIPISSNTRIDLGTSDTGLDLAFYAAARNLVSVAQIFGNDKPVESILYFQPTRVLTSSPAVHRYVSDQRARARAVNSSNASQFANSAYYMGSKRNLRGFLVEAISSVLPEEGVVIDLMCGSGAASGAFSRVWRTVASDLQQFCRLLAIVQGGGFSRNGAENLLRQILPTARDHAQDLRAELASFLDAEDRILHGSVTPELVEEYRTFVRSFPTYPDGSSYQGWNPVCEVEKRKQDPQLYPYCLFSAYFANIYFGLRQCVEIDSLRFSIDQIEDERKRDWALGALVATLSALGTTYGGHFAQPKPRITNVEDLTLDELSKTLEHRAKSVIHEFSVRMLNLAEESEKSPRAIEVVLGPWSEALSASERLLREEPVVVYLDAPYKREEYSRYYHVLETGVRYSYPACVGRGKVPKKGTNERQISEFFTRVKERVNQAFVNLISEILRRGWTCAWSYSDSGDADIAAVVSQVKQIEPCKIRSYGAPYEHKAQGRGTRQRRVTEYLIMLIPESRKR
jgi:hypothetical protein